MTTASIVQRLLDKKQITAEEAVVLLQNKTVSIPMYTPNTTPPPIWCSTDSFNTKADWEYSDTKYTDPKNNKK